MMLSAKLSMVDFVSLLISYPLCRKIALISKHKAHESEYLRKSIGNALRDISKKHAELIRQEVEEWDLSNPRVLFTYKLAAKLLK